MGPHIEAEGAAVPIDAFRLVIATIVASVEEVEMLTIDAFVADADKIVLFNELVASCAVPVLLSIVVETFAKADGVVIGEGIGDEGPYHKENCTLAHISSLIDLLSFNNHKRK